MRLQLRRTLVLIKLISDFTEAWIEMTCSLIWQPILVYLKEDRKIVKKNLALLECNCYVFR